MQILADSLCLSYSMQRDSCSVQQFEDGSAVLSVQFSSDQDFQRRQFAASVARVDSGEEAFTYLFADSEPAAKAAASEWSLQAGSVRETTRSVKPAGSADYTTYRYWIGGAVSVAAVGGLLAARRLRRKPDAPEAEAQEERQNYNYEPRSMLMDDEWRSDEYFVQYDAPWANPLYYAGYQENAEIELEDFSQYQGRTETRFNPMLLGHNAEYTASENYFCAA